MVYDAERTRLFRSEGLISSISEIFVDVTDRRLHNDLVEHLDPRGQVVLLESVMAAFNEDAASHYDALILVHADPETRIENQTVRILSGSQYSYSLKSFNGLLRDHAYHNALGRDLVAGVRRLSTLIVETSRPRYAVDFLIEILKGKLGALEWNYQNDRIGATLYLRIARTLDAIIQQDRQRLSEVLRIHQVSEDVSRHINSILHHKLLMRMAEENPKDAARLDTLSQTLHSHLSTPDVRVVRMTNEGKLVLTPKIVPKPWGMEVWGPENDHFGAKFIYIQQGEHESVQSHEKKYETQIYFSGGEVLDMDRGEFETRRVAARLGEHPSADQVEAFIQSLPYAELPTHEQGIRTIAPGVVHCSRATQGVLLHLEINSGEAADHPDVTTRLLDKYSSAERSNASHINVNWMGPTLPFSLYKDAVALHRTREGFFRKEPLIEKEGFTSLVQTPGYNVDRLRLKQGQAFDFAPPRQVPELFVVLEGQLEMDVNGQKSTLEAGEMLDLQTGQSLRLTALRPSQIMHVFSLTSPFIRPPSRHNASISVPYDSFFRRDQVILGAAS